VLAVADIYVDCRSAALHLPLTVIYVLAVVMILILVKPRVWAAVLCFAGFCIVLLWWLNLKPSNNGDWQANAARPAWIENSRDRVVPIHNLRNCGYRTETEYTNCWSDRTGISVATPLYRLFLHYLGTKVYRPSDCQLSIRGHRPHRVFDRGMFRYKVGRRYSAVLGFFRQYELVFITADERDVIRSRTNYRKHEEVEMYRTTVSPDQTGHGKYLSSIPTI
jgi:hypothetical protein